mmetsp:Transcript_1676/g.3575  ORF Transcript_1676/g.3575 Transcript_1676/m.3575 type:complete len:2295 (-) Transcript_1676:666-7550(-)
MSEALKTATSDLSSLGRVGHRLAMLDSSSKLQAVLDKLLARLLDRIGKNHKQQSTVDRSSDQALADALSKIHAKLVEILSHAMKRIRDDRSVKLNCASILKLLMLEDDETKADPFIDPFTLNLSLAYLTLGIPRCDETELKQLMPGLIRLHGHYANRVLQTDNNATTRSHWHQISHLLVKALESSMEYQNEKQVSKKARLSSSTPPPSEMMAGGTSKPNNNGDSATPVSSSMQVIHEALSNDPVAAAALYDLLLDLLFFHPTPPNSVPPAGCSEAGQQRLLSNAAWVKEMASPARLSLCKTRILEWIAPTLATCLFPENSARTCTLLLVASGNGQLQQVSNQASLYLKHFRDYDAGQHPDRGMTSTDNISLIMEILTLCVGSNNALLALSGSSSVPSLGLDHSSAANPMPFRRRMVSDSPFAAMMIHAEKVLAESPLLFHSSPTTMEQIGSLTLLAASKMLSKLRTSSGLTALKGKPYVSAAQVLNALVVRCLSTMENETIQIPIQTQSRIQSLMAKVMALACTCLSATIVGTSTSTSQQTASTSEGNQSVRDALYGVICLLSRSTVIVTEPTSWLFALGKEQQQQEETSTMTASVDTTVLLFACVAKEEQALLPRATAALDAILAAYCRIAKESSTNKVKEEEKTTTTPQVDNPWMTNTTSVGMETDEAAPSVDEQQKSQLAKSLLPILWGACLPSQPKPSRLAASRWSSALVQVLDLTNACHILCFLAGDKDVSVASIARRGLGLDDSLELYIGQEAGAEENEEEAAKFGEFSLLTHLLLFETETTGVWRPNFWEFSPKGKATSIAYLLQCLLNDFYGGDDDAIFSYLDAVTKSLAQVSNSGREYTELLDQSSASLATCMSTSSEARKIMFGANGKLELSMKLVDLQKLAFTSSSSRACRDLAAACGSIYGDVDLWGKDKWSDSIVGLMESCLELLKGSTNGIGHSHGASFLAATCVKQIRLNPEITSSEKGWTLASQILTLLGNGTLVSDDLISRAYIDSLSVALSSQSRNTDAPQFDARIYDGATAALSGLSAALKKFSGDSNTDVSRAAKATVAIGACLEATIPSSGQQSEKDKLHGARLQCVEVLISLLGSTAYRKDEEIALQAGEALAAYAWVPKSMVWETKSSESWPEALDTEFAKSLPPHQQTIFLLLRGSKLTSNPMKRTAYAPVMLALVARAAAKVNNDPSYASTALVQELCLHLDDFQAAFISILSDPKSKHLCRESCCLGLAACRSIAKLSDRGDEVNTTLLQAFGQTTNYGTSAMQETQSQANRRRAQEAASENRNGEALAEAIGIEPEVGGAAGVSEASLGAYREMAEAAVALGRPDILYALFLLSVTHPIWSSKLGRERYGPSALLGENSIIGSRTNALELRQALRPHLGKIMPRLLRASHDPNKETREKMQNLWNGLTGGGADARVAISEHLLPIIDSLIKDTSHKLWRARAGATGALAKVLVGRSWTELGGGPAVLDDDDILSNSSTQTAGIRLLKLWNIAMRSLDDVRATVRENGEILARGLRSLTVRLCDPKASDDTTNEMVDKKSHARDSAAAAATSLRWLIKHGLNQPCAEAAGVSMSCLVGVISVVNHSILQPLVPDLLRSLLLAMSSLEPAALNYFQVRAAGQGTGAESSYGEIERLRLQVAQTGPLAEAVTKLLDMVPQLDWDVQQAVIPQLNNALRQSSGFTTRAAVADACTTLCNSCPRAFKFSGSNSTNPSVGLLHGFFHGAEREAGANSRNKMVHAFGSLAALCPGSSVRSLALRACNNYNRATGASHDPAVRLSAAIILRAIAVRAQDQFADGGNNNVWCNRVLPVSFIGMRDTDKKIAQLWKEVWDDGGAAASLAEAVGDFGTVLEEKLLLELVKECRKALADVSWSRRASGASALQELAANQILAPLANRKDSDKTDLDTQRSERRRIASHLALDSLVKVLSGPRLWSGKGEVTKAAVRIASNWTSVATDTENGSSLLVMKAESNCDLFVGDEWFKQSHEDTIEEDENEPSDSAAQSPQAEPSASDMSDMETNAQDESQEDSGTLVPVNFLGLCRLLLVQGFPSARSCVAVSDEEILPYRAGALESFKNLLDSLGSAPHYDALRKRVYESTSEKLVSVFNIEADASKEKSKEPPLVVARSLECYGASLWRGVGSKEDVVDNVITAKMLLKCLEQPAWTVREAAAMCCGSLVSKSDESVLCQFDFLSLIVSIVTRVMKDRKFWRVRLAGMKLLHSLVTRVPKGAQTSTTAELEDGAVSSQEILESVLPHKEAIMLLAKRSLSDAEAKVTAVASEVVKDMAWWP